MGGASPESHLAFAVFQFFTLIAGYITLGFNTQNTLQEDTRWLKKTH